MQTFVPMSSTFGFRGASAGTEASLLPSANRRALDGERFESGLGQADAV